MFKLNHRPIKLRGVNHHDIHPDVGRALREEHYREDIELMKKANINAVRTSHYPPHPVFLDLCDRYGIYVICEVPFGFGDKNLRDQSYGDILLTRAEATVARDKNHPSVLIWSIGNENPITPIVVNTANRVKELDPTRFRLLPGAMKHLTWVGDGPYNSYPGQTDAAERGIWHIAPKPVTDPESRYYEGNRANVDLAVVTDGKGNGIGVICDGSTVSLEEREGQQIFSQVLRSSGKGNKTGGMMTLLPVKAADVQSEKGTMRFVPLEAGKWPVLFEEVIGPVTAPHTLN